MLGLGTTELLIILGIVLVLFGPTLFAFWLGYTIGKKQPTKAPSSVPASGPAAEEQAEVSARPDAPAVESADRADASVEPSQEESIQ